PSLPYNLYTANQLVTNDAFGTRSTTTYSYAGGYVYFNTSYDRKFAGFGQVDVTDGVGNVTKTFFHQGNATATSTGEYIDHIAKAGRPYRVEVYDASNNLYSKTINKWEHFDQGNGRNFLRLAQTIAFAYDGDADHKDAAQTFSHSTTTGNLTQRVELGEVTGSDDGTYADTGTDKFTTDISYAASSTLPYFTKPATETTLNQSTVKVKETRHYYDLMALESIGKGNETKTEFWKDGSNYIDTENTYDSFGLITQVKDPRDKATTLSYDTEKMFVTTSTNPFSHVTTYAYDYSSGKVATTTNPSGLVFPTVYDGLDRVKRVKQPDVVSPTTRVTKTLLVYTDTRGAVSVKETNYLDSVGIVDTYRYFDGFARLRQERKE
ncbi:MAG: hypothetical protein AAB288_01465, partial [Acidobacteriota bacterium]